MGRCGSKAWIVSGVGQIFTVSSVSKLFYFTFLKFSTDTTYLFSIEHNVLFCYFKYFIHNYFE